MDEPAFGGSRLSAGVLKALRRPLLMRLREQGALSVEELLETRIEVLETRLTRQELVFLVESARRQQLVEVLGTTQHADGTAVGEAEWVLTERGRSEVTGFASWTAGLGSKASASLRTLLPLATALGAFGALRKLDVSLGLALAITAGTLYVGFLLLTAIWSWGQGASPTKVAQAWPRLRRDHPELLALVRTRASAMRWMAYSFVFAAAVQGTGAVLMWQDDDQDQMLGPLLLVVGGIPFFVSTFVGISRLDRANRAMERARQGGSEQLSLELASVEAR